MILSGLLLLHSFFFDSFFDFDSACILVCLPLLNALISFYSFEFKSFFILISCSLLISPDFINSLLSSILSIHRARLSAVAFCSTARTWYRRLKNACSSYAVIASP